FTAEDFCLQVVFYIEKILKTYRVPIIFRGSNSYIEKLVEHPMFMFKYKYEKYFFWIDGGKSVFNRRVDMRVDQWSTQWMRCDRFSFQMHFTPKESDGPSMKETNIDREDETKQMIIRASISSIKCNTRMLICNQLDKIQRLINKKMW
uniref:Uncharacterized protein n=1 Tax=Solanum lycopersicum TaxID=4081 RepID=A0A3Q7IUT1_SOLLC